MTKSPENYKSDFLKSLYKNNPKLRLQAMDCIRQFRRTARTIFPPTKGIWSRFYTETSGKYIHKKLGQHLHKKQNALCCYCRDRIFHMLNSNIEHILPIKHYPAFAFEYENLATACVTCNALKSDDDLYQLGSIFRKYDLNTFNCFHPNFHNYDEHVEFLKIQTNHIYVRIFKFRTSHGERLCQDLLKKVSLFNVKEQANPIVAEAVKKLGEYVGNNPGYESAASTLKRLAANL